MRYLRTSLKFYFFQTFRFRPGIFISILIAPCLLWLLYSFFAAWSASDTDPLGNIVLKAPGDTADVARRKVAIYTTLQAVKQFLDKNPIPKKSFLSIQKYPQWLPSIISKTLRWTYSCEYFNEEGLLQLPVFTVNDTSGPVDRTKVAAMATQLSADRFQNLAKLLTHWPAPLSVAVYVDHQNVACLREYLRPAFYQRDNLLLHFVPAMGEFYPVNQLRNIALKAAQTDYVLLNDVDFMPSSGMDRELGTIIESEFFNNGPKALVVPAFQLHSSQDKLPQTKEQLLPEFNDTVFMFSFNTYPGGHNVTDYNHWFSTKQTYEVDWRMGWEPYVLVKKTECPLLNQRFLGRLKDKVSYVTALHFLGFRFYVHPTAFLTHLYHPSFGSLYKTIYLTCSRTLLKQYTNFLKLEAKKRRRHAKNSA